MERKRLDNEGMVGGKLHEMRIVTSTRSGALRQGGAFTLVEILVVVAVLALLVAIAVPVLSMASGNARQSAALSKVRQCGATILAAAEQNTQKFPVVQPAPGSQAVEIQTSGATLTTRYFSQVRTWNIAIEALGGGRVEGVFRTDRAPLADWIRDPSDFYFGQAFMTGPEYWTRGIEQTQAMWRPVGLSEVLSPSMKAMLHDPVEGPGGAPVCFVDGHAAHHVLKLASPGVPNTLDDNLNRPLVTTVDGVRGRDYQ